MTTRICVIGAGAHCVQQHLPALALYRERHPDTIELVGISDLNRELGERVTGEFEAGPVFTDYATMLREVRPDACIAVTPVKITAHVAIEIMELGIPLLIEKPIGATPEEAQTVVDANASTGARVMVSMNRRFDPAFVLAREWIGERPIGMLRFTMTRQGRTEEDFMTTTGIHLVDAARWFAGEVKSCNPLPATPGFPGWFSADWIFANDVPARIDVLPTAGDNIEQIEAWGDNWHISARSAFLDLGVVRAWTGCECVFNENTKDGVQEFVASGAYAETEAFICGVRDNTPFSPAPADVMESVTLCHEMARR